MISKMILPLLGGTPSVWTTCMLFFQVILLAGYLYSHLISKKMSVKNQVISHIGLLMLAIIFLPIGVSESYFLTLNWGSNPVFGLLGLLLVVIGFPFFIVSASAPLLQKWFSGTPHKSAHDPYFLYAASNLGSLSALLVYPFLIEPFLKLQLQSRIWAYSYGGLIVFFIICGLLIWRHSSQKPEFKESKSKAKNFSQNMSGKNIQGNGLKRRLLWLVLTFIPSSLMLGVTSYLTSDVASVPLLWVIPLSIYLLSFILVFSRKKILPHWLMVKTFPITTLVIIFIIVTEIDSPLWLIFLAFLWFLFNTSMVCHGRLAIDRPDTRFLTEFYLFIAIGGSLGGLFNALLAPLLFDSILELPLVLILACFFFSTANIVKKTKIQRWLDFILPLILSGSTFLIVMLSPRFSLEPYQLWMVIIFGIPLFISYLFVNHPTRFALAIAGILLASNFFTIIHGRVLLRERNFFGTIQIIYDKTGPFKKLFHGTTLHGLQFAIPEREHESLSYYHRKGPFGEIYEAFVSNSIQNSVAVVGLGVGSLMAFSKPGQKWTFYEIDPDIIRIAQDEKYFTYLKNSKTDKVKIIPGDARLKIQSAENGEFDMIVIDAFSSDSIPIHLMTKEAFKIYLSKLDANGILAIHISSQNLDLSQVVGDLANDAGLYCFFQNDDYIDYSDDQTRGKYTSTWTVMSRHYSSLEILKKKTNWKFIPPRLNAQPWTDDFSNILSVIRWF
jgi:predicted membrane-bound spermidine synthase